MKLLRTNTLSKQIATTLRGDAGGVPPQDFWRGSWTDSCERVMAYNFLRAEKSNPALALAQEKMDKGTLYHPHIVHLINTYSKFKVLYAETELFGEIDGVKIKGHCDGVLHELVEFEGATSCWIPRAILEIKTTSEWSYNTTKEKFGADRDSWWYTSYYRQSNRYLHIWNSMYPHLAVSEVCLLLYNVNGREDESTGFCSRDWWFKPQTKDFQADVVRLKEIQEKVKDGSLPSRGYEKITDWHCKGCWWRDRCWKQDT